MHELKINVKVKGTVTEEQLTKLAVTLYTQVGNYLNHLVVKPTPIIWDSTEILNEPLEIVG